ncbi:hypothetical protein D3C80_1122650 [compost metagenome]
MGFPATRYGSSQTCAQDESLRRYPALRNRTDALDQCCPCWTHSSRTVPHDKVQVGFVQPVAAVAVADELVQRRLAVACWWFPSEESPCLRTSFRQLPHHDPKAVPQELGWL